MKLKLFFCLIIVSFYANAQQSAKVNYLIYNEGFESTLLYEKALSHTQLDGLRYLNTRRRINIEGTKISVELFSAQELLSAYGKPISPLTNKKENEVSDVKFKLSYNNYKLQVTPHLLRETASNQNSNRLIPKNMVTTFGGFIYDDGGANGNYANNKTTIQTIYSDNNEKPYIKFTSFSTENQFDVLYVYDGPDASSKLIGAYSGGNYLPVVKATGAYLTLVFVTDGSMNEAGWSASVERGTPQLPGVLSAPNCASADPFCSGTNYTFPATTGSTSGEAGPSYGCLGSEPNPAWYYMQVATPGTLVLGVAGSGGGDVDFVCWGPFTSPTAPCTAGLTGGCGFGTPTNTTNSPCSGGIVDCSYSANATETCTINNALAGQYYMMMITNFSNQTQNIQLSQTGGTGSTNCNIVNCGVTATNTGPYCVGQTISLSAATTNTTATTYSWTGPGGFSSTQQNPTITNATMAMAGTYSVTGTTSGTVTCIATTTVVVSTNTPPVVNSPTICAGGTATLTASGSTTYTWSTSATTNTIAVSPTTNTVYTVTGSVGTCTAQNTATVTVNPLPIIGGPSITICAQQTGTLCASGGITYTWTPGNLNGPCILVSPAVTTNYTVVGTDANGCTNIGGPVSICGVTVNPTPTVTATSNSLCVGGSAPISASGASSYTWSPSATLDSPTNPTVTANPNVTTIYAVTATNANGCVGAATSTVTVYPLPVFTVSAPPVCSGQTLNVNATAGYLYSINTIPPASNLSPPISIPNASPTINGTYIITAVDAHTCNSSSTVAVLVYPLPTITASATPVCVGSSGILTAYGAVTYTWNPTTYLNPSVGSNVSITPTSTTPILYTVIGQDANGCASSTSINVQPTPLPMVSISPLITKGCTPQCVTYTVTSNNAAATTNGYSWTFANGQPSVSSAAFPQSCFNGAGNNAVMLTYTDINGCVNTATASVLTYPLPVADFDYLPKPVSILTPDVHFNNETYTTGGAGTYSWNFGDSLSLADTSNQTNPLYTYANAGTYNVTLITTSPNGCKDTTVKTVVVEEDFAIYVPNSFTPNGDGKNETFKAEADGISNFTMYVFDRWGNNIFTTHDINTGWDGRRNNRGGEILQQDVYVWKIQVSTVKHQGKSYTGTVTLLK